MELKERIQRIIPEITEFRRDFHAHPELAMHEQRTSQRVRQYLSGMANLQIREPLLGTDVIAVLNADKPGPCLAIRADMDALPVTEELDLPYKSTTPGFMHACGHDGHTAILMGTAKVLSEMADELPGAIKFIFQPAEEDQAGGEKLTRAGALETVRQAEAAVGLHGWPNQPLGTIAIRTGPAMASSILFQLRIVGVGGHGAYPHRCIDPIVVSAQIINALQTIVARTINPLDAAVVTIGHIHAGQVGNVIPGECLMKGTIRYHVPTVGEQVFERVTRIVRALAEAHGATAELTVVERTPPMSNDAALSALVGQVTNDLLGPGHLVTDEPQSMGVEDFAFYAERVPAAMFRLGLRPVEQDTYPNLHHPRFDFNDAALPIGMAVFCEFAQRFLCGNARG